jgi:hypothetical protein
MAGAFRAAACVAFLSGDLVAQTLTNWNQILAWLQTMDLLRRSGEFRLHDSAQNGLQSDRSAQ